MGLGLDYDDGQTPLDQDEKEGLLITTITTRGELDEFEQLGVEKAIHPGSEPLRRRRHLKELSCFHCFMVTRL